LKILLYILVITLTASCNYFEEKKVHVEDENHEWVQEKLKTLDKSKVDRYPVFASCESLEEDVEAEKLCFIKTLGEHIAQHINSDSLVFEDAYQETVKVYIKVAKEGTVEVENVEISDTLQQLFPVLKPSITNSITTLPTVKPALRYLPTKEKEAKGEPVAVTTHFAIPITISGSVLEE